MSEPASEEGTAQWWLCPNEPKCPHAALFHDIEEMDDPLPRCCFDDCACGQKPPPVTHLQPPDGSGLTPCCGRTPFELPGIDRMTGDPSAVSCCAVTDPEAGDDPECE